MENQKRPNSLTIRQVNETGLLIEKACRLPEIKFYVENGSVLFWATVTSTDSEEIEALQYLTPEAAMKFAKAMEVCAVEAFKQNS